MQAHLRTKKSQQGELPSSALPKNSHKEIPASLACKPTISCYFVSAVGRLLQLLLIHQHLDEGHFDCQMFIGELLGAEGTVAK